MRHAHPAIRRTLIHWERLEEGQPRATARFWSVCAVSVEVLGQLEARAWGALIFLRGLPGVSSAAFPFVALGNVGVAGIDTQRAKSRKIKF